MFSKWLRSCLGLRGSASRHPLEVILYTRQGCHLCEIALAQLHHEQATIPFTLQVVDIDTDPVLVARHGSRVPVIQVHGKDRLWGRINPVLLRRLLVAESARR